MRNSMNRPVFSGSALRALIFAAAPLSLALGSCGDGSPSPMPTPTPTPAPTPTATASSTSYDVSSCLNQVIPGTNGATPASLVIPDTIKLDTTRPSGFPNGRLLTDPVVDVTLAVLFLDVNAPGQSAATFANLPLNPSGNDKPLLTSFPYLAAPQGTPPLASGTGSNFNFRTDPDSAFVRVDRTGMPAVATALIGGPRKDAYNDASPSDDEAGTFVPELSSQLTALTNVLVDDLTGLGLKPCAKPK